MSVVILIHFVHEVTLYISTSAIDRRLVTW